MSPSDAELRKAIGRKSKAWHASLTPAQKAEYRRKLIEGRRRAKEAREAAKLRNGHLEGRVLSISIGERKDGKYVPGTSRTMLLKNAPFDVDTLFERLMPRIKELKRPQEKTGRRTPVLDFAE